VKQMCKMLRSGMSPDDVVACFDHEDADVVSDIFSKAHKMASHKERRDKTQREDV